MTKPLLFFVPLLLAVALGTASDASAADETIALGEVAVPPASSGVDRASLALAARGELLRVDASRVPKKKRAVVVSVAIVGSTPSPFACTINAMLRDAKTGTMLAVIEGRARSVGRVNPEVRTQVLHAALRSALGQIPDALAAN